MVFETQVAVQDLDTDPATEVTGSSAELNGSFTGNGEETKYYFEWGRTEAPYEHKIPLAPNEENAGSPNGQTAVAPVSVSGLEPVSTYHFRIVATNAAGTSEGSDKTFETLSDPVVTALPTSEYGTGSAQINAKINPENGGNVTACHFEYITQAAFGANGDEVQALAVTGATGGTFSLGFEGQTTKPIPYNAPPESVQAALQALTTIGSGNVVVASRGDGSYDVEFEGSLADTNVPQLTTEFSTLLPPDATAVVSTTTEGGHGWATATAVPCEPETLPYPGPTEVHAKLDALGIGTSYRFRLVATTDAGTTYEPTQAFGSIPLLPTVDSTVASGVGEERATLSAEIKPGFGPTIFRFEYGTTTAYGEQTAPSESIGSDNIDHAATSELTGLSPETTYYFRVIATNFRGSAVGPGRSFTTINLPKVEATPISGVTQTSAMLNAQIDPALSPTTYYFEYGPNSSYGSRTPRSAPLGPDAAFHPAATFISGLTPGTTYYYRVVAENAAGTSLGVNQTFTTASVEEKSVSSALKCHRGQVDRRGRCVQKGIPKRPHKTRRVRHHG